MRKPRKNRREEGMDMKLQLGIVVLCAVFMASQATAAGKIKLKTEKDKLSYTKGYYTANNFKRRGVEVDLKVFLQGIKDTMSGAEPLMTVKEMVQFEENFQREGAAKKAAEKKRINDKNTKDGKIYLAKNAKKKGVKVLPSGLQYKEITKGKGKKPKATDKVLINYRGSMVDGTVFDDTSKHKEQPAIMPVSHKDIPSGWTEAMLLMTVGSKYHIVIPPSIGFKEKGLPPMIGPNVILIFEVELVSIEKAGSAKKKGKKN
jgi:FKBP-type peptidyl-prolyl cis-trans isomerase